MSELILRTQGITKNYGNVAAVDHLDIKVEKGEIYGMVGKNGAGKTTLLKMICGLSIPTYGSLELFGRTRQSEIEKARSRTGSIIETPDFFPYLSAKNNLEYYRIQRGIKDKSCIEESLKFVGLSDVDKKKFKSFSLGMKQRLGLALAIMGKPDLLILDEPINGLDPIGMAEFREMILKLNRERGTTILISSHILGELSQIATKYGFINKGKLVEQITASDLEEKCKRSLKIKVNDTNKAAAIIQKELSCDKFQITGENELQVEEFLENPEVLVRSLVLNDVMVSQVYQTGLSLEEYFLELVGDGENV